MSIFQINKKTYTSNGGHINISDNTVIIDGVVQDQKVSGVVEVRVIEGDIYKLTTTASVSCTTVSGYVNADGSVSCDAVGGNVSAGGSVSCDTVGGDVSAGGSVSHS